MFLQVGLTILSLVAHSRETPSKRKNRNALLEYQNLACPPAPFTSLYRSSLLYDDITTQNLSPLSLKSSAFTFSLSYLHIVDE